MRIIRILASQAKMIFRADVCSEDSQGLIGIVIYVNIRIAFAAFDVRFCKFCNKLITIYLRDVVRRISCPRVPDMPDFQFVRPDDQLPEVNVRVIVVCSKFRCQGYLDKDGVWRDYSRNEKLDDVIGWIPLH